tara:strand:- start:463 stop:615 length:153 start_codon:yes stop_codon:yes gene_type:complete
MLFKFDNFWKVVSVVIGGWVFYGIWDFELTVITLLCLILAFSTNKSSFFV